MSSVWPSTALGSEALAGAAARGPPGFPSRRDRSPAAQWPPVRHALLCRLNPHLPVACRLRNDGTGGDRTAVASHLEHDDHVFAGLLVAPVRSAEPFLGRVGAGHAVGAERNDELRPGIDARGRTLPDHARLVRATDGDRDAVAGGALAVCGEREVVTGAEQGDLARRGRLGAPRLVNRFRVVGRFGLFARIDAGAGRRLASSPSEREGNEGRESGVTHREKASHYGPVLGNSFEKIAPAVAFPGKKPGRSVGQSGRRPAPAHLAVGGSKLHASGWASLLVGKGDVAPRYLLQEVERRAYDALVFGVAWPKAPEPGLGFDLGSVAGRRRRRVTGSLPRAARVVADRPRGAPAHDRVVIGAIAADCGRIELQALEHAAARVGAHAVDDLVQARHRHHAGAHRARFERHVNRQAERLGAAGVLEKISIIRTSACCVLS